MDENQTGFGLKDCLYLGGDFRDFHCPALCLVLCYSSYLISFQHTYVFSFP